MKPLGQGGRGGTGKEHGCDGTVHDLHRCGRGLARQTGTFGAGSAQVSLSLVSRTNAVPCGGSTKLTLWHFTPRSFRACRSRTWYAPPATPGKKSANFSVACWVALSRLRISAAMSPLARWRAHCSWVGSRGSAPRSLRPAFVPALIRKADRPQGSSGAASTKVSKPLSSLVIDLCRMGSYG